jgi:GNAT superfamily N-acetyltransferase
MWKTILKEKMLIPGVVAHIDEAFGGLIMRKDGKRAGYVYFEDKGYVEIMDIFVEPQFRSLNIGSKAIEYLLEKYAGKEFRAKAVESAIPFWERLGFAARGNKGFTTLMIRR